MQTIFLAITKTNLLQFEVDQREVNTHIDICCPTKPGLVVSTVSTLETLGLEIEQCVISCFSDFSLQASCFEVQILLHFDLALLGASTN